MTSYTNIVYCTAFCDTLCREKRKSKGGIITYVLYLLLIILQCCGNINKQKRLPYISENVSDMPMALLVLGCASANGHNNNDDSTAKRNNNLRCHFV